MPNSLDITGQRYGKLVAIEPTAKRAKSGGVVWLFQCDCGNRKAIPANSVRSGLVKSCGCLAKPHGETRTRLHVIWVDMRQRCRDKNNKDYGAKGIKVCEEWQNSYLAFRKWAMENGYEESLSIDRIDSSQGYMPSNCRWATDKQQTRNTSRNHLVSINGESKPISEWCEIFHISSSAIYSYSRRNSISVESALFKYLEKKAV